VLSRSARASTEPRIVVISWDDPRTDALWQKMALDVVPKTASSSSGLASSTNYCASPKKRARPLVGLIGLTAQDVYEIAVEINGLGLIGRNFRGIRTSARPNLGGGLDRLTDKLIGVRRKVSDYKMRAFVDLRSNRHAPHR